MEFIFKLAFVLTLFLHSALLPAQDLSDKASRVDAIFSKYDRPGSTGAAVSVVQNGTVVYQKGFGMAHLEYEIPIDPSKTVFEVASVSKQFTSFCILLLEKEGRLSLDDDIRKYIPEVPDFGVTVTLRHLATHTSGLRDQWDLLKMAGWRMDDVITIDHVFRLIKRQKDLNFMPGEAFQYSNTGHTLLAEVVSRVSGMTFGQFAKANLFDPLGMNNSVFYDDHEMLIKNRAYSYDGDIKDGFRKSVLCISSVGATNLFTTVEDMAKWAMNFTNPVVGNHALIQKLNEAPLLNNGKHSIYSLGQFNINYKGLKAFEHSGSEAAFESYFIRFPEYEFAVSVFSNDGAFWAEGKALQIADIFLDGVLIEENPKKDKVNDNPSPRKSVSVDNLLLKTYCGKYWNEKENHLREIKFINGTLFYQSNSKFQTELIPFEKNKFGMKGYSTGTEIRFLNSSGEINMVFIDGSDTLFFKPVPDLPLDEFTGLYYSEELDTYYKLVIQNDELKAKHQRIPVISFSPVQEDRFQTDQWFFKNIRFERNKRGVIQGFKVSNRGVTNLKFVRVKKIKTWKGRK